ncbi:unnamed protein product [Lasius platythorax]|uniref:Uncharacterized protein n=1 Tax=Lasius platythorax TaxID=488582 RepID=A0AAV2NIK6_9HYME
MRGFEQSRRQRPATHSVDSKSRDSRSLLCAVNLAHSQCVYMCFCVANCSFGGWMDQQSRSLQIIFGGWMDQQSRSLQIM